MTRKWAGYDIYKDVEHARWTDEDNMYIVRVMSYDGGERKIVLGTMTRTGKIYNAKRITLDQARFYTETLPKVVEFLTTTG